MVRRRRLVHDLRATASPGAAMFLRATAAVSLALVACSGDPGQTGAGEKPYTLALVGDPDLTLHPGERRDLQILLAGEDQGPIANARVHFGFQQGEPAGGSLEAEDVTTDDSGIATARFLAAWSPAAGPFHVVATAPGLRAGAVAFRLSVVALRRRLAIVPTPAAGGKAQVFLVTTPAAEGPWQVTAQPMAGGAPVLFNVTVQAGGSCSANAQCSPGQICTGDPPRCADDGGSSCDDPRNPCPPGFTCVVGVCEPAGRTCDPQAPACGSGKCCDPSALVCRDACPLSCAAGMHCEPGGVCGEGACVPDETVPDVSGLWLTRHDYRIRDALPFTVQETFK